MRNRRKHTMLAGPPAPHKPAPPFPPSPRPVLPLSVADSAPDFPPAPADVAEPGAPADASADGAGPAPDAFPAGTALGRYAVVRRLGAGGFARVYQARDPDLEIDVAVKLLRAELALDADTVDKFRREASMAARLRHPNVITVLMVGRLPDAFDGAPPGTPYLVMDYLPTSLADRLTGAGTLAPEDVARVGAEVARGLAFAHRAGIIHRDVKPENILFASDGRAVVTDFGIARAVAGSPTAASRQVLLGTPTYFSPEQARGLPLDVRSDQYALGVTLFRAATGVLPFPGEDWYDVMRQHVEAQPPRVRALAPRVPPALDAVIARCLAKRPEERFPTADELAVALERARGLRPSGAMTVAVPARRIAARRSRRPWVLAAVGAAAVATAVYAGTARESDGELAAVAAVRRHVGPARGRDTVTRTVVARSDSASLPPVAVATARPADSASPRPAPRAAAARVASAALAVSVPPLADVYVDGERVARGSWRGDRVRPGRHEVRAVVASLPGCASADTSVVVDLRAGGPETVNLDPVGCGRLTFDVQPTPAEYRLVPARGGPALEGQLPIAEPLFLPDGDYELRIEATQCAAYTATVPVLAGRARTERARLICS